MGGYKEKDAAKDTGSSTGKVAEAWHDARTDSGARHGADKDTFRNADTGKWVKDHGLDKYLPDRSRSSGGGSGGSEK